MGSRRYWIVVAALVALSFAAGCGRRTHASGPAAKPAAVAKTDVSLPDWAPKDPSPEFLRAAKLMIPQPMEELPTAVRTNPQLMAEHAHYLRTLVPAYGLFGALTDQQVAHLLATREVRVPVKSMTPRQRRALDSYFETWRREMTSHPDSDLLVYLYKHGTKQDLSNLDAGFMIEANRYVAIKFWTHLAGGKVETANNSVACLRKELTR